MPLRAPDQTNNPLLVAREKAVNHEWREAVSYCRQALDQAKVAGSISELGHVTEFLATCYYKGSFHAKSRREFKESMNLAKDLYGKTRTLYDANGQDALSKRSGSRARFCDFWLEDSSDHRREMVERCISLSTEAAQILATEHNNRESLETRKDILVYLKESLHLQTHWRNRLEHFEMALDTARQIIGEFERLDDKEGLLEALHLAVWVVAVEAQLVMDPPKFEELREEAIVLGRKIVETSQAIATHFAACLANEASGDIAWDVEGDIDKALRLYRVAESSALETEDSLMIGRLSTIISSLQHWRALTKDSVTERRQIVEDGLRLAEDAIAKLNIPLHTSYLSRAVSYSASCHTDLAELVETEPAKKRLELEKAIDIATHAIAFETHTVEWTGLAHELCKAMYFLSILQDDTLEKTRTLKKALPIRQETVRVIDTLQPNSWNRGVMRNYLALVKAELANLQQDSGLKSHLLEEAVSHMQECLELCGRWGATVPGSAQRLARYSEWYGDILYQLYRLQPEQKVAEAASKAYLDAVEYLKNSGQPSPIPAVRWKIAKLHDAQGQPARAAEDFAEAAKEYRSIADKVPGASSAFHEVANYMDAWTEIEKARLHHEEEEYGLAFREYSKAATKLNVTNPWRYLSGICSGRASLEKAEELSREEKHGDSIESLAAALEDFRKAKGELEARLTHSTGSTEVQELREWLGHTIQRETYSQGRIALEEAKALDKKGEKAASSRKYQSASEIFRSLANEIGNPQDSGEMETLARFCDSWSKMKIAESRSSPELFADAAGSFSKVVDTTGGQTPRLLALANASICKALESGTRFRLTRNPEFYSDAKRHLETAADCYIEGGFKKTGSWTRATQRLFDALVFLADAETERDPRKKAEFYHLAEKQLELAGKLYGEAGFPSKKKETIEQLDRTREEKETLLTALEALAEIPTSSTTVLTPIPPTRSQAPGVGTFEDANLAGEVLAPEAGTVVGSDFTVNLDMVNVGKTTATLLKLENVVPEGLESTGEESQLQLTGNTVDLKGKRLEYLKTFTVKIPLRATRRGNFDCGPRVVFVDDKGNYRSYEFRSTVISVREPGISEAIGPSAVVSVPAEFRFEDERSREVFRHLVKVFVDDYMSRRIVEDKAGWRTMMEIITELKIPRSALYGPEKKTGPVLLELERRGLVETRVFPGERGRGGDIRKVRVAFENLIVRGIVEQAVMQNR